LSLCRSSLKVKVIGSKFVVTERNKILATGWMADRGVASAENKLCRKGDLNLKLR